MRYRKLDLQFLVFLASVFIFFAFGGYKALHASEDFSPVYGGARCLLHGCNPYDSDQWGNSYLQGGGPIKFLPPFTMETAIYPPSTLLVLSPFALFDFSTARVLWFLLNGSLYIVAVRCALSSRQPSQGWVSTILGSLFLITSGELLATGNPSFFSIPLIVIGSCLFLRGRYLVLASFLLILGLAVKPQLGGLIVLYLFTRNIYRRYAFLSMVGALVFLLLGGVTLSSHPQSRNWLPNMRENVSSSLGAGHVTDPRPENKIAIGDVNIQTLTSVFFEDAKTYDAVAFGICAVLLILFVIMAAKWMRFDSTLDHHALAVLSVLTLLPVYHRHYDTRLLLLMIPGIAIIFHKRRIMGAIIAAVTVLSTICIQCRVQMLAQSHIVLLEMLKNKIFFVLLLRQQNLALILLFCLYLTAVFMIRSSDSAAAKSYMADPYEMRTSA